MDLLPSNCGHLARTVAPIDFKIFVTGFYCRKLNPRPTSLYLYTALEK